MIIKMFWSLKKMIIIIIKSSQKVWIRKVQTKISQNFLQLSSTKTTSKLPIVNPSVGSIISSSAALLTTFAILITNDYISKLKTIWSKFGHWMNVITPLFEKTLKQFMTDKTIDEKQANEMKKFIIAIWITG